MISLLGLFIFLLPFALASSSSVEPPTWLSSAYLFLFILFAVVWIAVKGLSLKKLGSIKYPLLLAALLLIIAATFSIANARSLEEIFNYAIGLLLFLMVTPLPEEEKKRLTAEIVLSAFLISLLSMYQYFFGFHLLLDYVTKMKLTDPYILEKITQRRIFFPFPTPGILGGYLAMILPLTFSAKRTLLYMAPITLALLFTQSLGAFFSLSIVSIFFLLWRIRTPWRALTPLAFAFIFGGLFILRSSTDRWHLLPKFSFTARLGYWKDTWKIILSHPITGVGLGNFDLPLSRFAHNSFLQLWAEAGIAGIISFSWLVAAVLKNGLKKIRGSFGYCDKMGLAAGICIFLVHNLMDFTFFLPAVAFIGWIMLGLLYSPALQKD